MGRGIIYDQEKPKKGYNKFNEELKDKLNSKYGKQPILLEGDTFTVFDIEAERRMYELESQNRVMKAALIKLAEAEQNDYAQWVIHMLDVWGGKDDTK
ncbi:hypothetical protein Goe15_00030 [Bacillus phage vB_BsuP-Goe15]|nr:hypothetical protein Goe15_00030 [Bacillus phage vB_BsuP-Goe15]